MYFLNPTPRNSAVTGFAPIQVAGAWNRFPAGQAACFAVTRERGRQTVGGFEYQTGRGAKHGTASGPRGHTGAVYSAASNWSGLRRGGPVRPILIRAALTLIPLTIALLKLFADRPLPESSIQHFYIVSAASLLAAAVAAILA